MESLYLRVGFTFAIIESVSGILGNSYIIILNVSDWKRGSRLSLCDKMLVLIAVNNILLQCDLNICTLFYIMFPQVVQNKNIFSAAISACIIFQVYYSFWIMACLCTYYCLRIVSFKHRVFVRLKLKISEVVSRLLRVSSVGSFGISVLSIWHIDIVLNDGGWNIATNSSSAVTGNLTPGPTMAIISVNFSPSFRVLTIVLGCCLPFVLAVLSLMLTLISLWTHTWSMKQNQAGFSVPRLDAHLRVARIMVLLTILYVTFYISQVYLLSSSMSIDNFCELISLIFILIYPTAQSVTLILGNAKLRSAWMKHCNKRLPSL